MCFGTLLRKKMFLNDALAFFIIFLKVSENFQRPLNKKKKKLHTYKYTYLVNDKLSQQNRRIYITSKST